MRKAWPWFPCLVVSIVILISAQFLYAQPAAFLQRSAIIGVGNTIHITRVPTQDINGAVRYLDVDITLNVAETGVIDAATVVSVDSPLLQTNSFVAGNYQEVNGSQCTLATGVALEGRIAVAFNCVGNSPGNSISATWYTGPISGHPFELDLTTAGIDQIPGHENLSWGKLGSSGGPFPAFNCFISNDIIGANQVGNILAITNYRDDSAVDCGHNFTLVVP